jgi:hypothetical protein
MGVCLFIYFWGGFFGDENFTTWQQKENFKIRNSTTILYIPKSP